MATDAISRTASTPPQPEHPYGGRVAIVTGGSGAIGHAIAARLAAEGSRVHVFDLASPPAGSTPLTHHPVDVASREQVERAVAEVTEADGPVDDLICAAAIFPARPFLEVSGEEWSRTLAVNATGAYNACRAVLASMVARRTGHIVLFSSMLARTGGLECAAYAASKGAVLGLARSLALEVASEGVRVNTLTPGLTDTPQPRGHLSEVQLAAKAAAIPLGRLGVVEDMVEACLFLLGPDASFYTGQDMRVNGGSALW